MRSSPAIRNWLDNTASIPPGFGLPNSDSANADFANAEDAAGPKALSTADWMEMQSSQPVVPFRQLTGNPLRAVEAALFHAEAAVLQTTRSAWNCCSASASSPDRAPERESRNNWRKSSGRSWRTSWQPTRWYSN